MLPPPVVTAYLKAADAYVQVREALLAAFVPEIAAWRAAGRSALEIRTLLDYSGVPRELHETLLAPQGPPVTSDTTP